MHAYIRHNYITIGYASQESRRGARRGALAFLRSFPGSARGLISLPCSVVHFNPAHPSLLLAPVSSFRFVARRPFAGYTSRRAAGNGLTVGGEQLLPRKRFPSKLHLKNMIRLHSGERERERERPTIAPTMSPPSLLSPALLPAPLRSSPAISSSRLRIVF